MQDVYRRLSAPQALGGLLRVRTSPDFRTARAFGHLYPDDQYDNLFHVISCDPQDAFAFDFEFAKCALMPHDPVADVRPSRAGLNLACFCCPAAVSIAAFSPSCCYVADLSLCMPRTGNRLMPPAEPDRC